MSTYIHWPGKTTEVERIVLPFQSIEHIDTTNVIDVQQRENEWEVV